MSSACDFKSHFCKLLLEQSDQGPHGLPVCKNRFEKFARIFSGLKMDPKFFLSNQKCIDYIEK